MTRTLLRVARPIGGIANSQHHLPVHEVVPMQADQAGRLLYIRHDERADRAMITAVPEAHMTMPILARLDLLTLERLPVGI